jgi:hypothetical protein
MDTIRIEKVCNGKAQRVFQEKMAEALDNINNPDTPIKRKRRITIDFDLSPNEDRNSIVLEVNARLKLQPDFSDVSMINIKNENDTIFATEASKKQIQAQLQGNLFKKAEKENSEPAPIASSE